MLKNKEYNDLLFQIVVIVVEYNALTAVFFVQKGKGKGRKSIDINSNIKREATIRHKTEMFRLPTYYIYLNSPMKEIKTKIIFYWNSHI